MAQKYLRILLSMKQYLSSHLQMISLSSKGQYSFGIVRMTWHIEHVCRYSGFSGTGSPRSRQDNTSSEPMRPNP